MRTEPGQVYRVDLGISGKVRLMVVVSVKDDLAPRALAACVPITSTNRDSWYEIPLSKKPFLTVQSYANAQAIQSVQHHELIGPIGRLNATEMDQIRSALSRMLGITSHETDSN